ncbi:MAG: PHP domain-containing protein [Lachnospiraceae bacterium]|nr:PHP domain-containing protein [Lachnospiraceae bacterium]
MVSVYKYELHAHTSECDRDARLSARELVHLYKEAGYDGIVITDHYIERFYTLWFPEEVEGLTHEQQVRRWLKGFYTAREEGEKVGITVLPGAEVRFDDYPNDYLIYGLHEDFFYTVPRLNELKNVNELLALMPEKACVVHAHPFRDEMVVANPKGLFGIEVFNGGTEKFRNEIARQFADYYGIAMTSGSDIHGTDRLAKGGIMTKRRIQTPEDLVSILRSGEYSLIEND